MELKVDMLHGPIWSRLPMFALPVALTSVLEQMYNAADVAVAGNFTGSMRTAAVAAIGANSSVIALIINLFVGIALGANVVIANSIGRNDFKTVKSAVHTSLVFALLAGIFVTIIGELAAEPMLSSFNIPDDVMPLALAYLRIYLLGMPVILMYNFESAIFRSVGDAHIPLIALGISSILNVILDLLAAAVLHMGVASVAATTVFSNFVSCLVLLGILRTTRQPVRIDSVKIRIDTKVLGRILKIGVPAGVQSAVFALSNIVIQTAINSLGTVVIAASSAAYNIEVFAYDVLNSFSQACTTFVGQNAGAGKLKRCKKVLALCLIEDAVASAAAIFFVLFFGRHLLTIFTADPKVIKIGYTRLIMVFSAYTFSMLYEVMSGYLRGFGISLIPAVMTIIGVCGIRITWILFIFPQNRTFRTIMSAYPASLATTALLILILLIHYRPSRRFTILENNSKEELK